MLWTIETPTSAVQVKIILCDDPIRSDPESDPESDSESNPDFVNGQYEKAFESAMSASFVGKQIT